MHNGSVCLVAGNRIETFSHVERLFGTECVQFPVYADFRFPAGGHCFFQPFQEFDQCYAVSLHGSMKPRYLLFVPDGFQQSYRRGAFYYPASGTDCRINGVISFCRIYQDVSGGKVAEVIFYFFICVHRYAVDAEVGSQSGCDFPGLDKIVYSLFFDQQVAHRNRVTMHIVSPDVEQPCYLVQRRQQ